KQTLSVDELKKNYAQLAAFIKNGYAAYRITYNTKNENGGDVIASGALFVPDANGSLPLLSYNHGTLFPSKEKFAPSYLQSGSELNIGKMFAGTGYIVAMADYIGYGSTKTETHPYGVYSLIAGASIDMLYAVQEFCKQQQIQLSGKNFFSGWSEGAAVALAAVKKLEEDKSMIVPAATVLNAGPYYSSNFVTHIFDAKEELKYINSYAWVLSTYNRLYKINKPMDYYFKAPVAVELKENPEARITHDPQELFTDEFRNNYQSGKDSLLQQAMNENDLWNWKPKSKIVFCHGDQDDYVPLFNSEKAYNEMLLKGADVSLKLFKGQNHVSGVYGFLMEAYRTFEAEK
ncbi:MAG: hypothetical protein ABIN36_14500, partial [Ferruginibacter sp.]